MVLDVLTPPALQKPAAVTEPEPEIDRLLGLRELLCTLQPTAMKSALPLNVIAPLTVLLSASTQAGGPEVARAAVDRTLRPISETCMTLISVVLTRASATTVTLSPATLAETAAPLVSFALKSDWARAIRCASLLTLLAVAAPSAAMSVAA